MPRDVVSAVIEGDPQAYENEHVHGVYEQIASHFSMTRYKPWPVIAKFLADLPDGWVGLDSGTGNGKYLPLPLDRPGAVWTIGLDRSQNLLSIARHAGDAGDGKVIREVVRDDVLGKSWRPGIFDYSISVATIHHLATAERRKSAIKRLLLHVSPEHGRILIYVWAIEQDSLSKRDIPHDAGSSQDSNSSEKGKDIFVPWVLSQSSEASKEQATFHRYYHMFAKGELSELVSMAATELGLHVGPPLATEGRKGIEIVQDGWERSNYYVEIRCWQSKS
ncbi:hypothetical protein HGRIS_013190 [Hohenbuehelia grisea]|uniref:Methyltransferase type 11 domain-containing protein n=1 Tax=Hohenbuehelia grisea TaxID=104357 RepID=A0ABR3IUR0_9AGAR